MTKRLLLDASQPEEPRVVGIHDQQQRVGCEFESTGRREERGEV
jgi:hypothetical protein